MTTIQIATYAVTFGGVALAGLAAYLYHVHVMRLEGRERDARQETDAHN